MTAVEVEAARNRWVLTPANSPEEVENWQAAYVAVVGPPPPGSKPLKEVIV